MRSKTNTNAMFRVVVVLALLLALGVAPVLAAEPPYLKLAQELGTPHLADSAGPSDKSRLLLHFVPQGQTATNWTKMTTISILKVSQTDTDQATRTVIRDFRDDRNVRRKPAYAGHLLLLVQNRRRDGQGHHLQSRPGIRYRRASRR